MVRRHQQDGLGSASQASRDRSSRTSRTTNIPAVGQQGGTQGPGSDRPQLSVPSWDPEIEEFSLFLSVWGPSAEKSVGTIDREVSGGIKQNKRFSTQPSSMGESGAFTISQRAAPSISGSPVSGPLAFVRPDESLQAREGRDHLPRQVEVVPGHNCIATNRSTGGSPYTLWLLHY